MLKICLSLNIEKIQKYTQKLIIISCECYSLHSRLQQRGGESKKRYLYFAPKSKKGKSMTDMIDNKLETLTIHYNQKEKTFFVIFFSSLIVHFIIFFIVNQIFYHFFSSFIRFSIIFFIIHQILNHFFHQNHEIFLLVL